MTFLSFPAMLLVQIFLIYHLITLSSSQLKPAIRVRLNRGIFEQTSSIVAGLVEYEVPRVRIPNSQQCFTEGCVQIHSFRMSSFRQPSFVSFMPAPPNRFVLRVTDFDFFVTGHLSGAIQVLIQIPVMGSVMIAGRGISVIAHMDLQKTYGDEPYLRFLSCQVDGGSIDSQVSNMGIFTDTVNSKYRATMSSQARLQLEQAICANMNRITQQHFSSRLDQLPSSISAKDLLDIFISDNVITNGVENKEMNAIPMSDAYEHTRVKRESEDYYDDIDVASPVKTTTPWSTQVKEAALANVPAIKFSKSQVRNFFNIDRLSHILIDLTLLDAYATSTDFTVGMTGTVTTSKAPGFSPYELPFPFRVPSNEQRRQVEILISNHSINSLLYQAHRTNSLLFHVDSKTPGVGTTLKTTCSMDQVCISDEIEEVGAKYPDRSLELIIRSVSPPTVRIDQDNIFIDISGRCLFFLEGTRQKVGVIPFDSSIQITLRTEGNFIKGKLSILSLTFDNTLDFFGLSASELSGFRNTIRIALENLANATLRKGIPLNAPTKKLPLRLNSAHVTLVKDMILLQANVDLYSSLYSSPTSW